MSAREHHAVRCAPDWSRRHHLFRHLDGSNADWRSVISTSGEPSNWTDACTFLKGASMTLLGTFILLLIFGIHP